MGDYSSYFLMKPEEVPDYVQAKLHFFPEGGRSFPDRRSAMGISITYSGCGPGQRKIHYCKTGRADHQDRAGSGSVPDRGRIEAEILKLQSNFAPGLVPEIYLYDEVMCAMIMEDMVGHTMMRTGLLQHETYPEFAEDITTFMAGCLIRTSDLVMDHKEKKELVKAFTNPDLCGITEDLVLMEPYTDCFHRNHVYPPNEEFIQKEVYGDQALCLEAAKLKFNFMNNPQALIHGDLHTGSIFINQEHTFVFDPEFASFGPMGYDIGNMVMNLFFAWCNGEAEMEEGRKREDFLDWCMDTIADTVDLFVQKYDRVFDAYVTEPMAKMPGFKSWYLSGILADTAGYAGTEGLRRIHGMANVKDITSIEDVGKRTRARAHRCLLRQGLYPEPEQLYLRRRLCGCH